MSVEAAKNEINMIKVYFDGMCGLCSAEIRYYQSIAPPDVFEWIDIAANPAPLFALRISQAEGLRILHVLDANGDLMIGVNAFRAIWNALPRWRILSQIIRVPGIYQSAEFLYQKFADYRFSRLEHCQVAATTKYLKPVTRLEQR